MGFESFSEERLVRVSDLADFCGPSSIFIDNLFAKRSSMGIARVLIGSG